MEDSFLRSADEVLEYFGTDPKLGLSTKAVTGNFERFGPNRLPPPVKTSWFSLILKQFEDLLVIILLASAVISLVLGFLEDKDSYLEIFIEPSVIMLILIANAIVGVWQESSAEEAIEKLQEYEARTAVVIRNGETQTIDREALVPGDLVLLAVGGKIPADCRLIDMQSRTIRADESMLTGESVASGKIVEAISQASSANKEVVDQAKKNMLFSGTLLVHGKCRAVVALTGSRTSIGKIQEGLMDQEDSKTPLGEKLDEFAEFLSKVILAICVVVWLINIGHFSEHGDWLRGAIYYFKIAVALAVAAIPEGLPAVVTTCLALGTMKMAKKNAIVRSLPSVETLGCTTVICSDKTGTLTTNQMSVRKVLIVEAASKSSADISQFNVSGTTYAPIGDVTDASRHGEDALLQFPSTKPAMRWISKVSSLCNDSKLTVEQKDASGGVPIFSVTGEPTEGALKVLAEKLQLPSVEDAARLKKHDIFETFNVVNNFWESQFQKETVLEFTRDRKSMSVFVRNAVSNEGWLLVKGAPESILQRSTHVYCSKEEKEVPLTDATVEQINHAYLSLASQGLRCLAIAYRQYKSGKFTLDTENYAEVEQELVFVGIVGMLDPPRTEVVEALRVCNEAGIRVVVITGDNIRTAEAICREIGLFSKNEDLSGKSFLGADFMALSPQEQRDAIGKASLFSRVMPRHKYHLVELMQEQREVVAMTGDGVNDAPALKKADIGIGMGSGTEVARHASDMILSDDNFATIVSAVEEGRAIYANTKQFIRYLISSNIGEVACIFFTAALGLPESLIPVQLLWVNLVTDGLPATALGFNKPDKDIMTTPPRGRHEKIINGWMFFRYFLIGIYVGVATILGFVWWFCWYSGGPQVTFGQLSHFHACGLDTDTAKTYFSSNDWSGEYDCSIFRDARPCTVSLSILVTIEMFNTFNALSENQSLLVNPPWANIWVVLAVALSMFLHCGILYIEFFRHIFSTAASNIDEWMAVLLISFPVIVLDEILKFFSRRIEERKLSERRKTKALSGLSQFERLINNNNSDFFSIRIHSAVSSSRLNCPQPKQFSFYFQSPIRFFRSIRRKFGLQTNLFTPKKK